MGMCQRQGRGSGKGGQGQDRGVVEQEEVQASQGGDAVLRTPMMKMMMMKMTTVMPGALSPGKVEPGSPGGCCLLVEGQVACGLLSQAEVGSLCLGSRRCISAPRIGMEGTVTCALGVWCVSVSP